MSVLPDARRVVRPPSDEIPPGVTLTAIDGGNTYYASQGHTVAQNSFTVNGATYSGWDDEDFFPIGLFLEKYNGSAAAAKWTALNCNFAWAVQGDADLALMNTNGHQLGLQTGEWLNDGGNNIFHATLRDNAVGLYMPDEPGTLAEAFDDLEDFPCSGTPPGNGGQTGRFFLTTFTHNNVRFFDVAGTDMDDLLVSVRTTPCSTRTLGVYGVDQYFYNGSRGASPWPGNANGIYARAGSMTADLMQRGCRYTDLVKFLRLGNTNHGHPAFKANTPVYAFVETGTSYNENTAEAHAIRSAEINAAVWGTIIGGARFVAYFTLGDGSSWNTDGLIGSTFWDTPYNGDSVSNYDQVAATNTLIKSLAAVINSPTATGYLSVSPSEQVLTSSLNESGYATMVKYYNRGGSADNRFYIFAIPRYGNRTHNNAGADTGAETWPKTATFTIPNTGASQVTVINEARTISITGGGTTFQDNFATRETVHIYRVDD